MQLFKTGLGANKVTTLTRDHASGAVEKLNLGTNTLSRLLEEYVLFTYAPLLLYSQLDFNPVQEWINLTNRTGGVRILALPTPIFKLANKPTRLDNIIWLCEKEYWPNLAMHIGSIGLVDHDNGVFTRTICQAIPVLDVAAVSSTIASNTPPSVTIYTFSVDDNNRCLSFMPAKNLFVDKPFLASLPPMAETIRMANALFSNKDPYEVN